MPATATAISCPGSGYCIAVDGDGGAMVYQNGAWSAPVKIDGNNQFATVSCVSQTGCAATDQFDNVLYYKASGS